MVQWLGFYPSKVEVGVRFTVVARNFFFLLFFFHLYSNSTTYRYILILLIIGNRDFKAHSILSVISFLLLRDLD